MIGLKNGIVTLSEYDDSWKDEFEKEKSMIQQVTAGSIAAIEHIGSTSVPGLCAKPIIDILIGIKRFQDGFDYVESFKKIGYTYKGENGIPYRHYFEKGDPRTHHVHMVEVNSTFWKEHLLFRDYLRNNPEARDRYANLKRSLALRYPNDRDGYLYSKADFIQEVIKKAREK